MGRKFSCSQWGGPSMQSSCLAFFPFKFVGGGKGGKRTRRGFSFTFPWFLLCSPSSQCIPQHVLHSTSPLSHMLWQMLSSFHLYMWAKEEELYTSIEPSTLASLHGFIFFSDLLIKIGSLQKKKLDLGGISSN